MTLYTIGYNGFNIDQFIATLQQFDIEFLIDIRELALSRKKGFSKRALIDRLSAAGIQYDNLRLLGSPKEVRTTYQQNGNSRQFFDTLAKVYRSRESSQQIDRAVEIAGATTSCLMCCCADWMYCHRKAVVEAMLAKNPLSFCHVRRKDDGSTIAETVTRQIVQAA
ncbi:MAG: DUF488 domain-containing protein [Planctomycetes bacterium]|nr:DUF488 domain-containing protein [Planctomycetota bacterium]